MAYTELVVLWQGALGGMPGYSKFRFIGELTASQLNTAAANLRTFLLVAGGQVPNVLTLTIQPSASFHADDGTLTGEIAITTPPAAVPGGGAGVVSAASGFMVRWITGAINGGHKVEGRTYFVPVVSAAFQADGTIADTFRTTVQTAANVFATSTPSPAVNSRSRPGNPAAGNQTTAIVSATVPDKQVVMRSRRD
jgi:hypothetical protein